MFIVTFTFTFTFTFTVDDYVVTTQCSCMIRSAFEIPEWLIIYLHYNIYENFHHISQLATAAQYNIYERISTISAS